MSLDVYGGVTVFNRNLNFKGKLSPICYYYEIELLFKRKKMQKNYLYQFSQLTFCFKSTNVSIPRRSTEFFPLAHFFFVLLECSKKR